MQYATHIRFKTLHSWAVRSDTMHIYCINLTAKHFPLGKMITTTFSSLNPIWIFSHYDVDYVKERNPTQLSKKKPPYDNVMYNMEYTICDIVHRIYAMVNLKMSKASFWVNAIRITFYGYE